MFRHDPHADVAYAVVLSGMKPGLRAAAPGIPSGFSGFASSAWVTPLDPSSFRSFHHPARQRCVPVSRVSHVRACAPFAPARFARPIAPARAWAWTPGALIPSVSQGLFRAGAKEEAKRPRDVASLPPVPIWSRILRIQPAIKNYFIFREQTACLLQSVTVAFSVTTMGGVRSGRWRPPARGGLRRRRLRALARDRRSASRARRG